MDVPPVLPHSSPLPIQGLVILFGIWISFLGQCKCHKLSILKRALGTGTLLAALITPQPVWALLSVGWGCDSPYSGGEHPAFPPWLCFGHGASRGLTIPTLSGCRCVGKSGASGGTAISIHPGAAAASRGSAEHISYQGSCWG